MNKRYLRSAMVFGMAVLLTTGYTENYANAASVKQAGVKHDQNSSSVKQLSKNNSRQDVIIKKIKASGRQIEKIQKRAADRQSAITNSQIKSELMKDRIKRLRAQIKVRDGLLKKRIRSIYINGGTINYLDVLLGAESFGNFLDRLFALKTITETDNRILTAQENDKKEQVTKIKALQAELKQMKRNLADLKNLEADLLKEKKNQQSELALLRKEASKIKEQIMGEKEERDVVLDQKRTLRSNAASPEFKKLSFSKSIVINPAQGYISSGFGYRSFDNSFHPGIDIANNEGTPVMAAADGVVFRAYRSSSYGNTVMVSHQIEGKLYTSVYAHLNTYNVSAGERVTQGQVIGGMGSTGESFGSHLHFEIYEGPWTPAPHKGAVNPENFIRY
ncbi:MAG: murein DD-endopeptidase MepM [Sporolactobacillus laevolacticus]|nr:murein DD-endopeptidase MepM [Sporolactobacillus laevolacticus]